VAHRGRQDADDALAMALAKGATVRAAAILADVAEKTAHRRLKDAAFRAKVAAFRAQLLQQTIDGLTDLGSEAVKALRELLAGAKSEVAKLGAARAVLDFMLRGQEQVSMAAQLAELQQQVEELQSVRGDAEPDSPTAGNGPAAIADPEPDPGPAAPGPGEPDAPRTTEPGPVAGADSPLFR